MTIQEFIDQYGTRTASLMIINMLGGILQTGLQQMM